MTCCGRRGGEMGMVIEIQQHQLQYPMMPMWLELEPRHAKVPRSNPIGYNRDIQELFIV